MRMVDVARRAGVSRALVSLVLSGKPGASPANREKVLAAAAELGYSPDSNAARLRSGGGRLVGVVFDGHDAFTARVLDAAHEAVAARGEDLVLTMASTSVPLSRALGTLRAQRVRGALVISSAPVDEAAAALLAAGPAFFVGAYPPVSLDGAVGSVHTDDDAGVREVVRHLVSLGHRSLLVTRVAGRRSGDVRADAALEEARALGVGAHEVPAAAYDESAGVLVGREMLRLSEGAARGGARRPTALVAANDALALGAVQALRAGGVRVPEDVSVTGFDDAGSGPSPAVAALGLTTVHQDAEALVGAALELLDASGPAGAHSERVLRPALVVRSTTAAPSA